MKRKETSSKSTNGHRGDKSKVRKIASLEDLRWSNAEYELGVLARTYLRESRSPASESDLKTATAKAKQAGLEPDALDRFYETVLTNDESKESKAAFDACADKAGVVPEVQAKYLQKKLLEMLVDEVDGELIDIAAKYVEAWDKEDEAEMQAATRKAMAILTTPLACLALDKIKMSADDRWLLCQSLEGQEAGAFEMAEAAKQGKIDAWDAGLSKFIHWRNEQPEDPRSEYKHSVASDVFNRAERDSLSAAIKKPNNVAMIHHIMENEELSETIQQDDLARDTYPPEELIHYLVEHKDMVTFRKLHDLHSEDDPKGWRDQVVRDLDMKYQGVETGIVGEMRKLVELDEDHQSDQEEEEEGGGGVLMR